MAIIARILGVSFLTSALAGGLGAAFLGMMHPDWSALCFFFASISGIIGAIAAAAREIAMARTSPRALEEGVIDA